MDLPRSGWRRSLILLSRSTTSTQKKCWVACCVAVAIALVGTAVVFRAPATPTGALVLTQAELDAIKARVAAEQQQKFDAERLRLQQETGKAEADIGVRLATLEQENVRIRDALAAKDAELGEASAKVASARGDAESEAEYSARLEAMRQQAQTERDELEESLRAKLSESEELQAELDRLRREAAERQAAAQAQLDKAIERGVLVEVSREELRRQAAVVLEAFCSLESTQRNDFRSDLVNAAELANGTCVARAGGLAALSRSSAVPKGAGAVAAAAAGGVRGGEAQKWQFPVEAGLRRLDATAARALVAMALPDLVSVNPALSEDRADGANLRAFEATVAERCCDTIEYAVDPALGAFYRMRVPMGEFSDAAGDQDADQGTYRSVCFWREWDLVHGTDMRQLGTDSFADETVDASAPVASGDGASGSSSTASDASSSGGDGLNSGDGDDGAQGERHLYVIMPIEPRFSPGLYDLVDSVSDAAVRAHSVSGGDIATHTTLVLTPMLVPRVHEDERSGDAGVGFSSGDGAGSSSEPATASTEAALTLSSLDALLQQVAANATRVVSDHAAMSVKVAAPLTTDVAPTYSELTTMLEAAAGAQRAGRERTRFGEAPFPESGGRPEDEHVLELASPWASALLSGLRAVPRRQNVVLMLDEGTTAVPPDFVCATFERAVHGEQLVLPIMWALPQPLPANIDHMSRLARQAAYDRAAKEVRPVPFVSTVGGTKADLAWVLLSLLETGGVTGDSLLRVRGADSGSNIVKTDCSALSVAARAELLGMRLARVPSPRHTLHPERVSELESTFDHFFRGSCGCEPTDNKGRCAVAPPAVAVDEPGDKSAVLCALEDNAAQSLGRAYAEPLSAADADRVYRTERYVDPVSGVEILAHVDPTLLIPASVVATDASAHPPEPVVLSLRWTLERRVVPSGAAASGAGWWAEWLYGGSR